MKKNFSTSSDFNNFSLTTMSTFSQPNTQIVDYLLIEKCFKNNSYEIFQFLDNNDLDNLKLTNKFFNNLCECHYLFNNSINSLNNLFNKTINDKIEPIKKGSKLREKYYFNKPMETYYKNSKEYKDRIQSGMRRKKNNK